MPVRSRLLLALCLAPLLLLAACTATFGQPGTAAPTATPAPTITSVPTTIALPAVPISGSVLSGVDAATPTPRGSVTAVGTGSPTATRTRTATPAATTTPMPGSATSTVPAPAPPPPAPATATAGPGLGGQLAHVANNQILARQPGAAAVITLVADPGAGMGGNPTRLRWAPSGRRLLYTLEPAGALTRTQVLVYDVDNGQVHNLGAGLAPAWAADSDHVALTRIGVDTQQVVIATLSTGQQETLGRGQAPAWLPDGRLAIVRDSDIWLLAVPGGAATQLTHLAATTGDNWVILSLAYYYSGKILLYGGQTHMLGASGNGMGLYAVDLATGEIQPWAMSGGNGVIALDIAPDGRYIALADQAHSSACASYGAITLIDTATGHTAGVKLPATDADHAHVQGVSWAPQPAGRLAVAYSEFQCTPDKAGDLGPVRIYLVDVADPNTLRDEVPGAWPAWNRGREGLGAAPLPGGVFGALLGGRNP